MSLGTGRSLKAWGKVTQALQKALHEQQTWKVAQNCLQATPRLGVRATTQTTASDHPAESTDSSYNYKEHSPLALRPPSPAHDLTTEQGQRLTSETVDEIKDPADKLDPEEVWDRPPPYAPQNGTNQLEERRGAKPLPATDLRGWEKEGS